MVVVLRFPSTVSLLLLLLVAVVFATLGNAERCHHPHGYYVAPPYQCWRNHDHNENTYKKIDCRPGVSFQDCLHICTPAPRCYGIAFITRRSEWKNGKYCCFLKTGIKCNKVKYQRNRTTCKWIGYGGDSANVGKHL